MTASSDDSIRFVMPAGSLLLANLAVLWSVQPELAAELESLGDDAAYPVEASKSGEPTLALLPTTAPSLRPVYLHSRYRPIEEAQKAIENLAIQDQLAIYLLGFGLGYHAEAIFAAVGEETIVCVFEPDLRLLWTAFSCRDYSKLIASRRMMFFWRPDKSAIFTTLTPHSAVLSLGAKTIRLAALSQFQPEFFAQVEHWLGELASFIRTGMNTLVLNSAKTAENIAANIGWYAAAAGAGRLKDRYKNHPAVIVSAGPSLRKNQHLLPGLHERAVMIAVQTTLQPLVDMGAEPQFVTSLDYHEICSRFFEKLPPGLKTELVAEPKATNAIFRLHPGPITVLGNEFAEGLLRESAPRKPILPAGATVAHLAFYLAQYLGCDPIIFVGQDLAFSDGLYYAPGTSYEDVWQPELSRYCTVEMKQWEQIVRDRYVLRRVPDQQGNPIYTEERLFMYLQQFERDFGQSAARIIDATEGGALKRGTTPMTLAAAIEQYCKQPLPKMPNDHPGPNWSQLEPSIASLRQRQEEAREIGRISRLTLPLLEELRDNIADQTRVNRIIARIDPLRAQMDQLGRTYDMVTQLTQQSELKRFERDRQVAASKATGIQRQQLQVDRDIENVQAVIDAAAAFERLIDDTISRLKTQIPPRSLAA